MRACAVEIVTHMSQEPFLRKFRGKVLLRQSHNTRFARACAVKRTWTCHTSHVVRKITGKMPYANPAASILCEGAQSKCTCWKLRGKVPNAPATTSMEHRAFTLYHTVWPHCLGNQLLHGEKQNHHFPK